MTTRHEILTVESMEKVKKKIKLNEVYFTENQKNLSVLPTEKKKLLKSTSTAVLPLPSLRSFSAFHRCRLNRSDRRRRRRCCRSQQLPDLRDNIVEHWCFQFFAAQEGKEHVQDLLRDVKGFALQ